METPVELHGTPSPRINSINRAKIWAGLIGMVFVYLITFDLLHLHHRTKEVDSFVFGSGEFQIGGEKINNKDRTPDTGVWISGAAHDLQRRGRPRWIIHGFGLLAAFQMIRHLHMAYPMPGRRKESDVGR